MELALRDAREYEAPGSAAQGALDTMLVNQEMSRRLSRPICQDTGTPIFEVHYPVGWSTRALAAQIKQAVVIATEKSYLRPNAVDSISGANSGDNTGTEFPTIHFHEWDEDAVQVDLMLKGGGCENVGAQYSLPNAPAQSRPRPGGCAQGSARRGATRRRARAARRACSACPLAATAARPMRSASSSYSGRWATAMTTPSLPR